MEHQRQGTAVRKRIGAGIETMAPVARRLPVGAEPLPAGTHFRVWAPGHNNVEVLTEGGGACRMEADGGGYFAAFVPGCGPGATYQFRLDGGGPQPGPASRCQPRGPHGPSLVVDPNAFTWTDTGWHCPPLRGQVIYELHVGTFTREGTFAAAARELPRLAELGVSAIELMPVAEFSGPFNW